MANGGDFLNIPTRRGLIIAFIAVVLFVGLAGVLYNSGGKGYGEFVVKLADYFMQGAVVTLLFAILKGVIDGVGFAPK